MTTQIKTCKCCGTKANSLRQRVCRVCKVPAIWDKRDLSLVELKEQKEKHQKFESLIRDLLK